MKSQNPNSTTSDLMPLISIARTRPTKLFAYGFVCAFVACTAFLAFNASSNASSPWFDNVSSSSSASSFKASGHSYQCPVSSLFSRFLPNSSPSLVNEVDRGSGSSKDAVLGSGSGINGALKENQTQIGFWCGENEFFNNNSTKNESGSDDEAVSDKSAVGGKNQTMSATGSQGSGVTEQKQGNSEFEIEKGEVSENKNLTNSGSVSQGIGVSNENQAATRSQGSGVTERKQGNSEVEIKKDEVSDSKNQTKTEFESQGSGDSKENRTSTTQRESKANSASSIANKNETAQVSSNKNNGKKREKWIEDMIGCDIFDGHWVKDKSYPLYPEGSCSNIDESFNCYLNGRPDRKYQKLRWQPTGCKIPRFNGTDMLERLRGKQLVFVGDSLNRNMFESLVCILKNSVEDKNKAFEGSGRREFRSRGSSSFLFTGYNATVQFVGSTFLVQKLKTLNGKETKETLRLDMIDRSFVKYKDADIIVFNSGHWWTDAKTSGGKGFYQEGNTLYGELHALVAFHKALNTWARWVDANVNPKKTFVLFRGYSPEHYRGGQWNSGGSCDIETEPIQDKKYLSSYPPNMKILESVIKGMKTPVSYMNITRLTDYRKDAHPSVYRKPNLTEEERKSPKRSQDCGHWCLPGVPDSWNELLYAEIIIKQYPMGQ